MNFLIDSPKVSSTSQCENAEVQIIEYTQSEPICIDLISDDDEPATAKENHINSFSHIKEAVTYAEDDTRPSFPISLLPALSAVTAVPPILVPETEVHKTNIGNTHESINTSLESPIKKIYKIKLQLECINCNFIGYNETHFRKHYANVHNSRKLIACSLCTSTFSSLDEFLIHINEEKCPHDARYMCITQDCKFKCSLKDAFHKHVVKCNKSKIYACRNCGENYDRVAKLIHHMELCCSKDKKKSTLKWKKYEQESRDSVVIYPDICKIFYPPMENSFQNHKELFHDTTTFMKKNNDNSTPTNLVTSSVNSIVDSSLTVCQPKVPVMPIPSDPHDHYLSTQKNILIQKVSDSSYPYIIEMTQSHPSTGDSICKTEPKDDTQVSSTQNEFGNPMTSDSSCVNSSMYFEIDPDEHISSIPGKDGLPKISSIMSGVSFNEDKNISKPWMCRLCSSSFDEQKDLGRHLQFIHNKEGIYQCSVCDKHTLSIGEMDIHIQVKHDERYARAISLAAQR